MTARKLVTEAIADLAAQRLRTLLIVSTLFAVAVLMVVVDRETAAARDDLADLLDSPDTTLIRFRAYQSSLDISPEVAAVVARLDTVQNAFLLSPPQTVTNSQLPARTGLLRFVASPSTDILADSHDCDHARATPRSAATLGLVHDTGAVDIAGGTIAVTGPARLPPGLDFLSGSVLLGHCDRFVPLQELVVQVDKPEQVAATQQAVLTLFTATERANLDVESAQDRIDLATEVAVTARASRDRLAVTTALGATILVALLFSAVVVGRRRDYGRRRALGATRQFIWTLVLVQAIATTALAVALAIVATVTLAIATSNPTPNITYLAATAVLLTCGAGIGSLIPALIAATGDPIQELRVP